MEGASSSRRSVRLAANAAPRAWRTGSLTVFHDGSDNARERSGGFAVKCLHHSLLIRPPVCARAARRLWVSNCLSRHYWELD